MASAGQRLLDALNRFSVFLGVWVLALAILTIVLVEVVTPLSAEAMRNLLNSSLTVTAGLLVGVFFVAVYSAEHLPPTIGQGHRRALAYRFLVELVILTLGLVSTVAGVIGAVPAVTALLVVLVSWMVGVLAVGEGLFKLMLGTPPAAP